MNKLLITLLLIPNLVFAQKDATNLNLKVVTPSEIDSYKSSLDIWRVNYLDHSQLLQFYKKDGQWMYRQGIMNNKGKIIIFIEDSLVEGINQIKKDIEYISTATDQNDIDLHNDQGVHYSREQASDFFSTILDGVAYKIKLVNGSFSKEIIYNNPETYLANLKKHNLNTTEHNRFIEFISYYETNYGPLIGYQKLIKVSHLVD